MDDATFEGTIKRIDSIFTHLLRALSLDKARIKIIFERERSDHDGDGEAVTATMHPNWQYASGTMVVYVGILSGYTDDEIAHVLLHELVHYWLHPISRYGSCKEYDLLEERICTDIALSVASLIDAVGTEMADNFKLEIKRLEKEIKKLTKALPKEAS